MPKLSILKLFLRPTDCSSQRCIVMAVFTGLVHRPGKEDRLLQLWVSCRNELKLPDSDGFRRVQVMWRKAVPDYSSQWKYWGKFEYKFVGNEQPDNDVWWMKRNRDDYFVVSRMDDRKRKFENLGPSAVFEQVLWASVVCSFSAQQLWQQTDQLQVFACILHVGKCLQVLIYKLYNSITLICDLG